jgi:serine/threonine protein kinase
MLEEIAKCGQHALQLDSGKYLNALFQLNGNDQNVYVEYVLNELSMKHGHLFKRPKNEWSASGGFKRMFTQAQGMVTMMVPATRNFRVLGMLLREVAMQVYLSKYDICPAPTNFRVFKLGTLHMPIFEIFFEMEKLDITAHEFLLRSLRTRKDVLSMVVQVISILHRINELEVCHGDLKLDNIMAVENKSNVLFTDPFGLVTVESPYTWKLIDFGLSSRVGQRNDLFFFCWFMIHRARNALKQINAVNPFEEVLKVPVSDVPEDLQDKLYCHVRKGNICFNAPTGKGDTTWQQRYGLNKDVLYMLMARMPERITLKKFLQSVLNSSDKRKKK